LKELTDILEKIGAHDYAIIEKKYGEEMWRMFMALENEEIEENGFYTIIEKANHEYEKLNGKLGELLEAYFVNIHMDLIEVLED